MNGKPTKPMLAVAIFAAATLACRLLSPSATAVPATSPAAGNGNGGALFTDNFSDSTSGWEIEKTSDDVIEYANGGLRIKALSTEFFTWSHLGVQDFQDIHMEVTAIDQSTSSGHSFGLMCDQQGNGGTVAHYWFGLDPAGYYEIGKRVIGKDDVVLSGKGDWATSKLIQKNAASYRLGADCAHGNLTFYVDGQKLESVADSTYTHGIVALFVWSGSKPAGPVTFDDFVMTSLK